MAMDSPAFAVPPLSTFRGVPVRQPSVTPMRPPRSLRRRATTIAAVAPREERRAKEIQRVMKQIEELRAAKAAQESAAPPPPPLATSQPPPPPPTKSASVAQSGDVLDLMGKHGEKSHFCPMSTQEGTEFMPRIVPVVGKVPGVSATEFRATGKLSSGKREAGFIGWTRIPGGFSFELVAVNCPTDALGTAEDVVALRIDLDHIAPSLGLVKQDGVIIVDRGDTAFDDLKFYAWDVHGDVHIGWLQNKPDPKEATILGRVLCCHMEEDKERTKAKSCWREEDEVW